MMWSSGSCNLLFLITKLLLDLGKVKVFASSALEDVQHVQACGLEVRCCVIRLGDEDLRLESAVDRFIVVRDADELLMDWTEQFKSGPDFLLGIACLDSRRHHADEPALGRHLMGVADERNVDVRATADLLLRNDNLRRQSVFRVGNWVIHQTNAADDLSDFLDLQ